MANDPTKQLLVKLGISTSDWKRAVQDIKSQLQAVNDQAKADFAAKQALAKKELDLTKQQVAEEKRLQAEARSTAEIEKAKISYHQAQAAAMKTKAAAAALESAEAKKLGVIAQANATIDKAAAASKSAAILAQTVEIKKQQAEQTAQLAIQRQQIALEQQKLRLQKQQSAGGGERGGGGLGGALSSITGGIANMFGGGLAGGIASGVLVGGGVTAMIEASMASIEKLVDKLKEVVKSDGPLMQLEEQFQKLGKAAGLDTEKYFDQLSEATRGLVNKTETLRLANQFLQSGMKVSTGDMLKMTEATVALARGQGKDATDAVNALSRAMLTGRFQTLSMVTGIQRADLQLRGLSAGASSSERATAQFNLVLAALENRLQKVGEPALTFTERLKQLQVAQTQFLQSTAQGFVQSPGMQQFSKLLGDIVTKLTQAKGFAEKLGYSLGQAFGAAMTVLRDWGALVADTFGEVKKMIDYLSTKGGGHDDKSDWLTNTADRLTSIRGLIFTLYNIWLSFDGLVRRTGAYWKNLFGEIKAQFDILHDHRSFGEIDKQYGASYAKDEASINADIQKRGQAMVDMLNQGPAAIASGTTGSGTSTDPANLQAAQRKAQLMLQLKQATAKQELEIVKERVEQEKILNEQAFDDGKKQILAYVAARKTEEQELYNAKVREINLEKQAKLSEVTTQAGPGGHLTGDEAAIKRQTIDKETQTALLAAKADYNNKVAALDKQLTDDLNAAARTREQSDLKITQEGLEKRKILLEAGFKSGQVSADEYIQDKKQLALEEYNATVASINERFKYEKQTNENLAKMAEEKVAANKAYQQQITETDASADQVRLQAAERYYKALEGYLQSALNASRTPGSVSGKGVNTAITSLIGAEQSAIAEYKQQLASIASSPGSPQAQSQQWLEISAKINDANAKLQQYYRLLNQSKDIMTPLAGIFGSISSGFGSLKPGLGNVLGTVSGVFGSIGQMNQNKGANNNPWSEIGQSIGNIFNSDDKDSLGTKFEDLSKAIGPAIKAVGGFAQSILGAKDAVSGAAGGGMSGAGLGQSLSAGTALGPWGAVIGGVAGGILGGIMGHKAAQLQQEITDFNQKMKDIAQSMQDGATKMGDAIIQMKDVEQAAISQLGSSKKGRQQLPQLIDQYNQQIQALIEQQKTLLDQLRQQNEILEAPGPFQQYLSSLDSIIQKYEQFASAAAGNAEAVAQANKFLALSLQQYATTQQNQLNQAEEDAISNALNLNNLLTQRQQLLENTASQEEQILGQGVLSRTSTAASKSLQISDLMANEQQQMDQLNQQIAVAQYRFNIEQKIFGLTNDSTSLQMQLVKLQEDQIQQQTDGVVALQKLVQELNSGTLASALASGDGSTAFDILLAAMGFSTIKNFSPTVPTLTPGVPIGSSPYAGPNSNGLSGTAATGGSNVPMYPSYATGGYIGYDQIANLHKGELVLNTQQVDALIGKSSGAGLGAEAQMHAMATARIGAEAQLLKAKAAQSKLDMMHIDKINTLLTSMRSAGITASGALEDMLVSVYGTRGRYGSGGFNREHL